MFLTAVVLMLASCGGKDNHITVSDSQLEGLWQKNNSQEYWRYNADHTGVTWDEAEDVSEEESNLTFTWSIAEDVLTHVFTGAMENQAVPKVYTVKEINGSYMKWEDDYGISYTLFKVGAQ